VFPVVLPPLRDRPGDIQELIEHFSQRICEINGWKAKQFSAKAVTLLEQYPWPGNVRELRNAVERLLLLADCEVDDDLVRECLPRTSAASPGLAPNGAGPLAARVEEFERAAIRAELERTRHNMSETAKVLGVERSHLYKKCAQLGIQIKQLRQTDS